MKLENIRIGDGYRETRKKIIKSENLTISPLPAFCNSKYLIVQDLETRAEIYILISGGVIADITPDEKKAYDHGAAAHFLDFILDNF